MDLDNFYFFTGNSYAGKSTMVQIEKKLGLG